MKKIYSTHNRALLYVLKSRLEENEMDCTIKNENPPLAGEIPPVLAPPEIWLIHDEQLKEAKRVIEEEIALVTHSKKHWECPQCHEMLEGQFEVCWKCGSSKE